ncbi:MAG: GIY-YIG nuclease family protein [Flavobacteriales bacterium]|nr:GIY-YIG nuclease family protein [Flavobacteriales bacterium]
MSIYYGVKNFRSTILERHNSGGSKFTKTGKPWILVHQEWFLDKSEALRREKLIKSKKSTKYIKELSRESSSADRASRRKSGVSLFLEQNY